MYTKKLINIICFLLIIGIFITAIGCSKFTDENSASDSDTNGTLSSDTLNGESNSLVNSSEKATTKKETTTSRKFKLNTTNKWTYSTDPRNGVTVRNLTIDTGWGGKAVTISQLSDIHVNIVPIMTSKTLF